MISVEINGYIILDIFIIIQAKTTLLSSKPQFFIIYLLYMYILVKFEIKLSKNHYYYVLNMSLILVNGFKHF